MCDALQTEPEIELPCRNRLCEIAMLVRERHAQLDDPKKIDIAPEYRAWACSADSLDVWHCYSPPQCLIVIVTRALEVTDRPRYHTWKLRIHGHERVVVYSFPDMLQLLLKVRGIYIDNAILRLRPAGRAGCHAADGIL